MQDSVAALSQGCLGSEVCNDVHQPVSQVGDLQPGRNLLHQPQRIDVAPYVIQQRPCTRKSCLSLRSEASNADAYRCLCSPSSWSCRCRDLCCCKEQLRRTSHAGVGERQADQELPQLIIPLHLDKLNGLHGTYTPCSCNIRTLWQIIHYIYM